jgi:hypothetical protein
MQNFIYSPARAAPPVRPLDAACDLCPIFRCGWCIRSGVGTQDGAAALSYLKRFGSVTVLTGHIHQAVQKVEGNVSFHTATSTAL